MMERFDSEKEGSLWRGYYFPLHDEIGKRRDRTYVPLQ